MKPLKRTAIAVPLVVAGLIGSAILWRKRHPPIAPVPRPVAEERCDAHGWCTQSPAHAATMRAVWAGSATDIWTIDAGGSAWHFDGVRWISRYTGLEFPSALFGFGPRSIWIAGKKRAVFWDGNVFKPYDIKIRGELSALFGTGEGDLWASTSSGEFAHWDGHQWTVVESSFKGWLHAMWGAARDDLWAAGGQGEDEPSNTLLHYDGRSWTEQRIPCKCDITGLSGTARDDVWAVGSWGTVLHYDGHEWAPMASPAPRGLTAVWAGTRSDVWAVGEQGMVLHYDGKAWVAAKPDWKWFYGIAGIPGRELWAVGQDGLILHWHAENFSGLPKPDAPVAAAPVAAAPADAPGASEAAPTALDAAASAALARARSLQKEGKLEQAKAAFIEATGHGGTVHLRPLAEYAYALLLENDKDTFDLIEAMLLTSTSDSDPALKAQSWFNLALLYGKKDEREAERAALARSLANREQPRVRAKLKGRAACVAEMGGRNVSATVAIATGWKGVCASLGLCDPGASLSPAQARARACVTTSGSADVPDASHGCEGDGPWTSTFGYSMYHFSGAWIAPLGRDRFTLARYGLGSWPAVCQGSTNLGFERVGDYAVLTQQAQSLSSAPGRSLPQSGEPDAVCLEPPELVTTAVFSLSSAKLLAAVTVVDGQPVTVEFDRETARLRMSGGGCDGYLPLDGSMKWVSAE